MEVSRRKKWEIKVKQKVNLSLSTTPWWRTYWLIKHRAKKMYGGMEVYLHTFLNLELDGGEWSASRPGTHCIRGWVDPRADLKTVTKGKIPAPAGNRTQIFQSLA
jgi:hypothetical protein